jgi:RNA polymerase sigma factor (sigma-70 family)
MRNDSRSRDLAGLPSPSDGKPWPATIWELVRAARGGAGADRAKARERLVTLYYKPIYRFFQRVLRAGSGRVEDITQDFFARFIEKDWLKNVRYEKSFRSFLKVACRRHYINWCEAERARKPAAGTPVPIDEFGSSAEFPLAPGRFESLLDEGLRAAYIDHATTATKDRLLRAGKEDTWRVFEARTQGSEDRPADYGSLAKAFGVRVYDVRNRLSAARKIFREALYDLARERSDDARRELEELGLLKYAEG